MFFQLFGFIFGLIMALHYYVLNILLPAVMNKIINILSRDEQ